MSFAKSMYMKHADASQVVSVAARVLQERLNEEYYNWAITHRRVEAERDDVLDEIGEHETKPYYLFTLSKNAKEQLTFTITEDAVLKLKELGPDAFEHYLRYEAIVAGLPHNERDPDAHKAEWEK
ncbi:hypothetical protein ABID56_002202 [Alkalibacillus flavidus]|uniref:Uncharacterized protein n=1 Tax=Alkalibacillus flavidus TaxID=546021 RepID=A0ABV2KWW7_9BACI